jgi:integrase/recombinase XerC
METSVYTVAEACENYLLYLSVEVGLSKNTIRTYGPELRQFCDWLCYKETGIQRQVDRHSPRSFVCDVPIRSVTVDTARRYLNVHSKLRPRTRRAKMVPLRSLYQWLMGQGLVEENPISQVKLPKKDAVQLFRITEEETFQIFEAAGRHPDPKTAAQQKALVGVLVFGGLRRAELLDLKVRDVNLSKGEIHTIGKGQQPRDVAFHQQAVTALSEWLKLRPPCKHDWLWIVDSNRRLGDRALNRILDTLWVGCGLGKAKELRCHALRHAAVDRWIDNGLDLISIRDQLGHKRLSTTADYAQVTHNRTKRFRDLSGFKDEVEQKSTSSLTWTT